MKKYIIGIDEVGRGALAGRVVVAAAMIPADLKIEKLNKLNLPFRDSKKLSPQQREFWLQQMKMNPAVKIAVAGVMAPVIDKINIAVAANRAAGRAFKKLMIEHQPENCQVFLDGGLYIFDEKKLRNKIRSISALAANWQSKTVIRGDEKIPAVKLASIAAKVTRDRQMVRLHKKYPQYGFDIHKGYGTKKHFAAVRQHGPSEIHRLTFLKNYLKIKK